MSFSLINTGEGDHKITLDIWWNQNILFGTPVEKHRVTGWWCLQVVRPTLLHLPLKCQTSEQRRAWTKTKTDQPEFHFLSSTSVEQTLLGLQGWSLNTGLTEYYFIFNAATFNKYYRILKLQFFFKFFKFFLHVTRCLVFEELFLFLVFVTKARSTDDSKAVKRCHVLRGHEVLLKIGWRNEGLIDQQSPFEAGVCTGAKSGCFDWLLKSENWIRIFGFRGFCQFWF